jgi:hypothetical protein
MPHRLYSKQISMAIFFVIINFANETKQYERLITDLDRTWNDERSSNTLTDINKTLSNSRCTFHPHANYPDPFWHSKRAYHRYMLCVSIYTIKHINFCRSNIVERAETIYRRCLARNAGAEGHMCSRLSPCSHKPQVCKGRRLLSALHRREVKP